MNLVLRKGRSDYADLTLRRTFFILFSRDSQIQKCRGIFFVDSVVRVKTYSKILVRMGIPEDRHFLGTLNAGHPGGMLPLTAAEKNSLHNAELPDNLYVADAAILPAAMGNPPILTIMALAKKIASVL